MTEPLILFEIVSPSSATTDHIDKNREYRDTPSVRRCVIVEQASMAITAFIRTDQDWPGHLLIGGVELDFWNWASSSRCGNFTRT